MQRRHLLPLLAVLAILQVHALAQVSGTINAEPNPCTIERGRTACTSHITWTTQGVARAKVIVMDEHRRGEREQEFGTTLSVRVVGAAPHGSRRVTSTSLPSTIILRATGAPPFRLSRSQRSDFFAHTVSRRPDGPFDRVKWA